MCVCVLSGWKVSFFVFFCFFFNKSMTINSNYLQPWVPLSSRAVPNCLVVHSRFEPSGLPPCQSNVLSTELTDAPWIISPPNVISQVQIRPGILDLSIQLCTPQALTSRLKSYSDVPPPSPLSPQPPPPPPPPPPALLLLCNNHRQEGQNWSDTSNNLLQLQRGIRTAQSCKLGAMLYDHQHYLIT